MAWHGIRKTTVSNRVHRTAWYGVLWNGTDDTIWYGMVWYGMVWYGMVWYGMYGIVWCGVVWYGMVRYGMVGVVWYGIVLYGRVEYGMVWYGMVWHGMASYRGDQTVPFVSHQNHIAMHRVASHKHGTTWHRAALHDIAYHRIGAKTTFRFVSIRFASRITSYHAPHCTAWHGIQWRRGRDGRVFGDNSSMAKQ